MSDEAKIESRTYRARGGFKLVHIEKLTKDHLINDRVAGIIGKMAFLETYQLSLRYPPVFIQTRQDPEAAGAYVSLPPTPNEVWHRYANRST